MGKIHLQSKKPDLQTQMREIVTKFRILSPSEQVYKHRQSGKCDSFELQRPGEQIYKQMAHISCDELQLLMKVFLCPLSEIHERVAGYMVGKYRSR